MKKRILIVDDEPTLTFLLTENLADLGPDYEVEACNSGAEALALTCTQPFDLVITDLRMPGLNGMQLIRRLTGLWPRLKFILMTAYSDDLIAQKPVDLCVSKFIAKPFTTEQMLAAVRATLETYHSIHNRGAK
jgi:DNA-binding NtrC family response regulator